jgi:hypothetical protein
VIDEKAWRLGGYQMDLHPKPAFLGMMYEEKGRGILGKHGEKVIVPEGGKPKVTGKLEISPAKLADWNDYRIVARGNVLQHYVNGKLAMELIDEDPKKRRHGGALGLQLHVGPPMVAEFKDLVLSDLPKAGEEAGEKAGASTDKAEASKPGEIQWIWGSSNPKASEKVFFRYEFVLPPGISGATLEVVGDDAQRTWVNGHDLGMQMDWSRLVRHDVAEHLKPGSNVLAVEGRNASGAAGMAIRMRIELDDGSGADLVSDGSWRVPAGSAPPRCGRFPASHFHLRRRRGACRHSRWHPHHHGGGPRAVTDRATSFRTRDRRCHRLDPASTEQVEPFADGDERSLVAGMRLPRALNSFPFR